MTGRGMVKVGVPKIAGGVARVGVERGSAGPWASWASWARDQRGGRVGVLDGKENKG